MTAATTVSPAPREPQLLGQTVVIGGSRTREALDDAISAAISTVSAQDAKRWFRFCGYLSANQ
jgi:hypothetical protein